MVLVHIDIRVKGLLLVDILALKRKCGFFLRDQIHISEKERDESRMKWKIDLKASDSARNFSGRQNAGVRHQNEKRGA
ncbi:MAG: hypothetical protein K9L75_06260 [Spirochaetia bacterium]|nr:hypothetical protein [Spirochaetia bacterium]